MKKNYAFKALLISLALSGLAATFYSRGTPQGVKGDTTITNRTSTVEVVAVTPTADGRSCRLVLRNVSNKSINGYSIGLAEGRNVTTDLTSARRLVGPGERFEETLPKTPVIVIRDVIFEDGSIDGDAIAAQELLDRREGMQEQLERIVPPLNAAIASGDLEGLKAQIRRLPETTAPGRSPFIAAGMRNAKEDTVLELEKLDTRNLQVELTRLSERQNSRLMRLVRRN